MRVLQLLKTSVGATWALRQMRELVGAGVEVHAAMPAGGPLVRQYEASGVTVHPYQFDLPVRQGWRWPRLFQQLRGLVRDVAPDVVHSHFVGTTLTMRLALGRSHDVPRIFQVPGPLHLEHRIFRQLELASAGSADFWIGSCRWTCDAYRRFGVAPERIGLAYYGVDLDHFRPGTPGRLRDELGVRPDTRIVGMVAYLYAPKRYLGQTRGLKGHEDLIDAVAMRLASHDDLVCVMVGGPWAGAADYERAVRAYAARRCGDRVRMLGTRTDVPDLYADMDLVVHPSHSENVGGAAESLLLGVPTIATNVGGFPDLVQPGVTGWLVPPRRPELLASAIGEVLAAPAEARARAARGQSLARELMDVSRSARSVLECYSDILRDGAIADPRTTAPSVHRSLA